jgi:plastocyanin
MQKSVSITAAALALVLVSSPASAQGQGPAALNAPPTKVDITAKDFSFDPDRIVASRGQNIDLTLKNEGAARHSVVLKLPGAEVSFADPVEPTGRRTLSFRAPEEPGEYEIYCPMGNHGERGMTATLVVR